MRTSLFLVGALALLLSAPGAYALGVSPAHPGFEDGTQAPRVQGEPTGPTLRVATIENINTTVTYATIQAAHDAATPGDTLEVQGSPHTEGPQITITKGITLRGQFGTEVILAGANTINDGGDGRAWFLVTGANLIVKDLTFDGNVFQIYQGFRIKAGGENPSFDNCTFKNMIFPPYAGTALVQFSSDGMSVTDCTFTNIGRQGIFFFGTSVTSGVASGNVYTGKGAGDWLDYGIEIGGGAVATCTNNTITNNIGVALSDGSTSAAVIITTYFGPGTGGTLSGNFLNLCTGAIAAGFDSFDTSVITASDNDMSGNVTYTVNNTSATVVNDCSGNWWGSNVPATVAAGFTGAGGVDYTPWLDVDTDTGGGTGFQGDFSTLNVDDDSPQVGATGRVQEGAELVTASTVNVFPGTYPGTLAFPSAYTMDGVTISGTDPGNRPILTGGVNFQNSTEIDDMTLENLVFKGDGGGSKVFNMGNPGPVRDFVMDNCVIDGEDTPGRHGLGGNAFTGTVTMINNEFLDIRGWSLMDINSGSGDGGSDLPIDKITFSDNDIHDSGGAVSLRGFASDRTDSVFVQDNTWDNINEPGESAWAAVEVNHADVLIATGNSINDVAENSWGEGETIQMWDVGEIDVSDNVFTNNFLGIWVATVSGTYELPTGSIRNNNFTGHTNYAVHVDSDAPSGGSVDVTCNWYGTIDGPNVPPGNPTANDEVEGPAVYAPWLDAAAPGGTCNQYGGNNVAAEPDGDCISVDNPCETVPVNFNRVDTSNARGVSVTFQLSSELVLCVDPATSINQGTWLGAFGTVYQVLDNGSGSYTVDQSILGLPCGTITGGQLFTVDVKSAGTDGTGTITVTSVIVRDCANAPLPGIPGPPASITIDETVPVAVADIGAAQVKAGNDVDGTTKVTLTFTAPGDAAVTEVYRAPYHLGGVNAYPEYDDVIGAGPPATPSYPPAAPWTLTGVTATGQTDETTFRGYWYYTVFTQDVCGNWSPVSNVAGGVLNYHLGDVAAGSGDNAVDILDLTLLGANYGAVLADPPPDFRDLLDVGPTADFSVDALPNTDNAIQFEDLMMFAINHNQVSAPAAIPVATGVAERPDLVLRVNEGSSLTARLILRNHESAVKGIHSLVSFDRDALELVSVTKGGLVDGAFFATLDHEDGVIVDAAVMGNGLTFSGAGEVAELTFRRKQEGAAPELALADLRNVANRSIGDLIVADAAPQTSAPAVAATATATLELLGARPNPFRGSTEILFRLPDTRQVEVTIYDVSGRLVRTLTDRTLPAGEHRATWDGRTVDGSRAGAGIYFYSFRAGDLQETRKLLHVR